MLGNVTLQTDVPQPHVENSEVWLRTLYTEKTENEREMKGGSWWDMRDFRGVTKTRIPHIRGNLGAAYKMLIYFFVIFFPLAFGTVGMF